MKSLPKLLLQKMTDPLPDFSGDYPAWEIWLLVAGLKTIANFDIGCARKWYWNREALNDRPSTRFKN